MAAPAVNNTVYIRNLNEKVKRDELKKSLYAIFSQFGQILDIVTSRTMKMKGQAFVVFNDQASAANAVRSMQGFPFFEKSMMLAFARSDSDIIAKRKGTFVERPKRMAASAGGGKDASSRKKKKSSAAKGGLAAAAAAVKAEGGVGGIQQPIDPASIPEQPPNQILFLTNLPPSSNHAMLGVLFAQFAGFKEVRMVPGRTDIAFVEFNTEVESSHAKNSLNGFCIEPDCPMRITFAKK